MPTKRLLVDATHPEETRIVVTSGNRLEEFDFESASRRQLRGNIYLAKVTRVEPSLQAAFVEYGGNRHGFLAFSEIHPDYYQIPVADREALLADEAEEEQAAEAETGDSSPDTGNGDSDDDADDDNGDDTPSSDESVDSVGGGEDALEEVPQRKRAQARRYKIQEVIKRRQVMLVQVVKEERGNKGAALTTYLSLAGRYSVLMPNTARGGGISRKITSSTDRKRLKEIANELEVPAGMGVILRTAGAARTKAEVKRDFEYLMRLWENVRNLTLHSQAPCLVYEEGSLIKRTIRDLYNKDINEVWVSGEAAYREAKDFMRMIMPSHAKNVQLYKEDQPIFSRNGVEGQLDSMFSPQVTLPSGGYIVINPTEALVSIDVNSGRATKEHNIEDTALQTNLEAAEEVARQLRLRDLAGLIVIDFIDMMEKRSNRNVERRLKDALKNDRARIQVGRISHFGLLEMSRQRIRFGVVEGSTHICHVCHGAGIIRSVESVALMVMRSIEDHVLRKPGNSINVRVPGEVALYILNAKRNILTDLEAKYDLSITITADEKLDGSHFNIERGESRAIPAGVQARHVSVDTADMMEVEVDADNDDDDDTPGDDKPSGRRRRRRRGRNRDNNADQNDNVQANDNQADGPDESDDSDADDSRQPASSGDGDNDEQPRKRRRRGRRGGRRNRRSGSDTDQQESFGDNAPSDEATAESGDGISDSEARGAVEGATGESVAEKQPEDSSATETASAEGPGEDVQEKPAKKPRRSRRKKTEADTAEGKPAEPAGDAPAESTEEVPEKPVKKTRSRKKPAKQEAPTSDQPAEEPAAEKPAESTEDEKPSGPAKKDLPPEGVVVTSSDGEDEGKKEKPKKAGWWQRGFLGK